MAQMKVVAKISQPEKLVGFGRGHKAFASTCFGKSLSTKWLQLDKCSYLGGDEDDCT